MGRTLLCSPVQTLLCLLPTPTGPEPQGAIAGRAPRGAGGPGSAQTRSRTEARTHTYMCVDLLARTPRPPPPTRAHHPCRQAHSPHTQVGVMHTHGHTQTISAARWVLPALSGPRDPAAPLPCSRVSPGPGPAEGPRLVPGCPPFWLVEEGAVGCGTRSNGRPSSVPTPASSREEGGRGCPGSGQGLSLPCV